MPNFSTHCKAGFFAGAGCGLIFALKEQKHNENINWLKMLEYTLLGALGGLAGSALPDILEPAIHPNHRGMAHSAVVGSGIFIKAIKSWTANSSQPQNAETVIPKAFAVGYLSHLFLDGKTPKGLPFVG